MCDQSEVSYRPGNVVWVKLKPVWWPGVVANSEELPPDILTTLRKTPIAIVKFFQETDVYEYVHKLSNIYHYNCLKKNEFIRKGLDIYRSKNRDAPSNMKLFPEDVVHAEVLTGGNPNILSDKMFQPEEKPVYANLFASTKKSPKKTKTDAKKKTSVQGATQQSGVPRIITHPRFIKLSSGLGTDYEVRERKQEPIRAECDEEDNSPPTTYRCPDCDFTTIRLNVIVLHNKSHTRNYAKPKPSKAGKRKNISAVRVQERPVVSEWKSSQRTEPASLKVSDTNGTIPKPRKKGRPRKFVEPVLTASINVPVKTKDGESKKSSRLSVAKPKLNTPHEDEFQESLLEDWAEYETEQDNAENGDTSLETSNVSSQETSASETKTVDESHLGNKKDAFDFDDSEEQLVLDKSNIRAGRKIPRVLEDKSDEGEKDGTVIAKKRKISGVRGNREETKIEVQEETRKSPGIENARRRRRSSSLRKKSEETVVENYQDIRNNSESTDVKRRKISRTGKTSHKESEEVKEKEVKVTNLNEQSDDNIIEVSTTEVVIEEHHEELEVCGEIEIEETVENDDDDDDDEQMPTDVVPMSPIEERGNDTNEEEVAEFAQKVDELLEEVSVTSKLPEIPRSMKKEHIKSYNASLTKQDDDDDEIIESISLINDDSSDGFEEKKSSDINSKQVSSTQAMKNNQSNKLQNSVSETSVSNSVHNTEVTTSDSSPEIVSVEMPTTRNNESTRKSSTVVVTSALPTTPTRTPVRFTMTSRLKNINSNQMMQKSSTPNQAISAHTAKMLKAVQQQRLQQRSMLKQAKPVNSSHTRRLMSMGQQVAAINAGRSTSRLNTNKIIVVKPTTTQRPTTIANIDLTRSKDPVMSSGQVSSTVRSLRSTPTVLPKTLADNMMAINKVTQKNVLMRSLPSTHKPISTKIELVSSGDSALIPIENQSEIITVEDDIECTNDNVQTEEINYIVDEAGNVIAESDNVCSTSKKEDILAKALQDTDVIPTEMSLSGSTILLESCNIMQNAPSTTVYESVTINTPPIMSPFETPSLNVNANPIPEISEYIIISEHD